MSLADSLGPLIVKDPTPKRSDAQTPKRSGVQPFTQEQRENVKAATAGQRDRRPELPLQGTAKSKHPDFQKKTLYVRKATMRDAMRLYEDEGGVEASDLVQMLLERYVGGQHG